MNHTLINCIFDEMTNVLLLLAIALLAGTTHAQSEEELFQGEASLSDCFHDIPLTYKKRDELKVSKKAEELIGKELVLLHFNKKTQKASVSRYYLITETIGDDIFNYLISKENYEADKMVAVFMRFTPKYDRFYEAACFDNAVKTNINLQRLIQ